MNRIKFRIVLLTTIYLLSSLTFILCAEEQGHKHEEAEHKETDHKEDGHDDHAVKTDVHVDNIDAHADNLDDHEEVEDDHEDENYVKLTPSQIKEFGIRTGIAKAGDIEKNIELPGEITTNDDKVVHFVPRFTGVVKKIYKFVGDKVKKGDILAVIESNQSFQNYSVKSQISGTVIEKHLSIGEVVKDDVEIYVVADLRNVWVNLSAYQQDVPLLKKGQKVVISGPKGVSHATSTIEYISPIFDKKTRTALVRIQISNKDNIWRPGTFVAGKVTLTKKHVPLLVVKTSIQTVNNLSTVFIKEGDKFKAVPVKLGSSDLTNVEIISGLNIGQSYVKDGAFTLKADLGKSQFGDGHNH